MPKNSQNPKMKDMRLHPLVVHPLILMLAVKEAKKKQLHVNW